MTRLRKEIRSLSASEWDAVVQAFWVMKTVPLAQGIAKYGAHYITYDIMVAKHGHAALDKRGDQVLHLVISNFYSGLFADS